MMNRPRFEQLVVEALAELPLEFQEKLDNIDVVIEDWPTPEEMARAGLGPDQLLFGLYQGVPLTRRTQHYGMVLPDKITIYQRPIEIHCRTPQAIRRQIKRTVIHEIAHHFGLGEERLRELDR